MRGSTIALTLLLALVVPAWAALQVVQVAVVTPSATIPVTLAAGTAGATTLGDGATSASTTGATLPILDGPANVLVVVKGGVDWSVRVRANTLSGTVVGDGMTLTLSGPTTEPQVVVVAGALSQVTGTPVLLDNGGVNVNVIAAGLCIGSCTFGLQVEFFPPGAASPFLVYPYTLTVS